MREEENNKTKRNNQPALSSLWMFEQTCLLPTATWFAPVDQEELSHIPCQGYYCLPQFPKKCTKEAQMRTRNCEINPQSPWVTSSTYRVSSKSFPLKSRVSSPCYLPWLFALLAFPVIFNISFIVMESSPGVWKGMKCSWAFGNIIPMEKKVLQQLVTSAKLELSFMPAEMSNHLHTHTKSLYSHPKCTHVVLSTKSLFLPPRLPEAHWG